MGMPSVQAANQKAEFHALTLDETMVDAMIAQLQTDTPLSKLSHDEARQVLDRMVGLGFIVARED